MRTTLKRLTPMALLLSFLALWVAGEVRYTWRIRPDGVNTLAQHLARFGTPARIYRVRGGDAMYYELQGFPGGYPPHLAAPSSPPAYVYDGSGRLVDWCRDPGDQPKHREKWPKVFDAPLDLEGILAEVQQTPQD